jgi:hypothetical protein
MIEYKFLFKRIMLYIMRYGSDSNYSTLADNIQRIFSCDMELVLMVMRLYYGDNVVNESINSRESYNRMVNRMLSLMRRYDQT